MSSKFKPTFRTTSKIKKGTVPVALRPPLFKSNNYFFQELSKRIAILSLAFVVPSYYDGCNMQCITKLLEEHSVISFHCPVAP